MADTPKTIDVAVKWKLADPDSEKAFEVTRLAMAPGDVLVIRPAEPLDQQTAGQIVHMMGWAFPNNKIVVLDAGQQLAVVAPDGQ